MAMEAICDQVQKSPTSPAIARDRRHRVNQRRGICRPKVWVSIITFGNFAISGNSPCLCVSVVSLAAHDLRWSEGIFMAQSDIRQYDVTAASTALFGRVMCGARNHHIIVDGPEQNGCPGEEITPAELFLAGVACCGVEL